MISLVIFWRLFVPCSSWGPRSFALDPAVIRTHRQLGCTHVFTETCMVFKGVLICRCDRAMVRKSSSWAHRWVLSVLLLDSFLLSTILGMNRLMLHDTTVSHEPTSTPLGISPNLWLTGNSFSCTFGSLSGSRLWFSCWPTPFTLDIIKSLTLSIINLCQVLDFILQHLYMLF